MIWKIIKIAMARSDINSYLELAQVTGINPATLTQTRRRDPRSFRLYELAQIDKAVHFPPEEWQQIARHIFENRIGFDGIVVSHGTDTMAYTASAVTFMLPDIDIPVVFTGSQLPLADMLSDGPDNLRTAFAMAASGHPGVFLAFDRKVMLGCRAVKVRASGFSAFESVNAQYAGRVSNQGLVLNQKALPQFTAEPRLLPKISNEVFLLKLTPGLSPKIFDALVGMGYKGVVVEAFGLGGVNVLNEGLNGIRAAVEAGLGPIKINSVLIGGFNDDEIEALANLTLEHPVDMRFIELMPIRDHDEFGQEAYVPYSRVLEKLPEAVPVSGDGGVAKLYRLPGAQGNIGLISPVSAHFCGECNRLRLTADGKLKPCLHAPDEYSIKGLDREAMKAVFAQAIWNKPAWHGDLDAVNRSKAGRNMNEIGG